MSEELKPCPFCGGGADVHTTAAKTLTWVECAECEAQVSGDEKSDASDKWNRRPEGQAPAAPPSIPRDKAAPTKEQALRDLAFIEDIWEMAPDLPYTKRLRLFIEAASSAPPSGVQAAPVLPDADCPEFYAAFEKWATDTRLDRKRKGDGYRSATTQLCMEAAFGVVNRLRAAAPPVAPAPAREGAQPDMVPRSRLKAVEAERVEVERELARVRGLVGPLATELEHAARWFDQLKPEDAKRYREALNGALSAAAPADQPSDKE
jgi:Lar family restriction alleviation protein